MIYIYISYIYIYNKYHIYHKCLTIYIYIYNEYHIYHKCLTHRATSKTCIYVSIRQHTSAYVSIRQHTSAYVSIRQHTSAYPSGNIEERSAAPLLQHALV